MNNLRFSLQVIIPEFRLKEIKITIIMGYINQKANLLTVD
jgi:hypothetical protein